MPPWRERDDGAVHCGGGVGHGYPRLVALEGRRDRCSQTIRGYFFQNAQYATLKKIIIL